MLVRRLAVDSVAGPLFGLLVALPSAAFGGSILFGDGFETGSTVAWSVTEPSTGRETAYDGVILDRENRWDGYPAHLFDEGKHKVWWCSEASGFVDAIYYSEKAGSLGPGGWSTPQMVLHHSQITWANAHVCDPSVVKGSFSYGGQSYAYALYFTTNTPATGGENEIGVAFSNNGLSFVAVDAPVISPSGNPAFYGAGMSGVAFDPVSGLLQHVFLDTSYEPNLRLRESEDGLVFTPTPPHETQLHAAGRLGFDGQGPDIAFNPFDGRWYGTIKNHDHNLIYDGETRVLRSLTQNDLLAAWEVIGVFNSSVTGEPQNHNPGLGKHPDGQLLVDGEGWAYVHFSIGLERPDVHTWRVAQGRFRPLFASVIWLQPQPQAGFGPPGSLVVAGRAVGAPSGERVTLHWRNLTAGGAWNTEPFMAAPDTAGLWYHAILDADYEHLYEAYVDFGGGTSESCTIQGGNIITLCP
jgi:hypothetical protein